MLAIVSATSAVGQGTAAAQSPRDAIRLAEVQRQESLWTSVAQADPKETIGSRQIIGYALALAETRQHPERLERLFDLMARMQDRDRQSKTCGNLKWRWGDAGVNDLNAVEFCLHDALLLWKRHREWIPVEARPQLSALIKFGQIAVQRHRVPVTYTNIALLRAANLIVLGEVLRRADVAEEGGRRLDEFVSWTASRGIHECVSPNYYGVDINALLLISTCSQSQHARQQADALLRLVWTDIALNWFPASQRLGGSCSRTYDPLASRGALDWHLWANGWFSSASPDKAARVEPYWNEWTPAPELKALSLKRLPRQVRQSWGDGTFQSRTYMVYRDVGLSTLSAAYGPEDIPLAIDLPGPRDAPRGYFRADGRQDPYGTKKYASGRGGQMKANHLTPFWLAAQRGGDALAVAVFGAESGETADPQAHLVLPRNARSITIQGASVDLSRPGGASQVPVPLGQSVVIRYGTAAVGIRILLAQASDGRAAPTVLLDDGNSVGCIRLTTELRPVGPVGKQASAFPGSAVVMWVRVGSDLDDAAFAIWEKQFMASAPERLAITNDELNVEVPGVGGSVVVAARLDNRRQPIATRIVPEPSRCVLELDGNEVGRPLFEGLAPAPDTRAPNLVTPEDG